MARFANDKFSILSRRFGSKQSLNDLSIYDYNIALLCSALLARLSILPDDVGWAGCADWAVLGLEDLPGR